jgi:hypothetical protein
MVLDGSVRDSETAHITADPVSNRLVIQPNHEPEVEMIDEDEETDEDELDDSMQIEEIDD